MSLFLHKSLAQTNGLIVHCRNFLKDSSTLPWKNSNSLCPQIQRDPSTPSSHLFVSSHPQLLCHDPYLILNKPCCLKPNSKFSGRVILPSPLSALTKFCEMVVSVSEQAGNSACLINRLCWWCLQARFWHTFHMLAISEKLWNVEFEKCVLFVFYILNYCCNSELRFMYLKIFQLLELQLK